MTATRPVYVHKKLGSAPWLWDQNKKSTEGILQSLDEAIPQWISSKAFKQ